MSLPSSALKFYAGDYVAGGEMLKQLVVLALTVILGIPLSATATDYYADSDASGASDSNDGLAPTLGGGHGPWLSIGKCASTITAGDVCNVLVSSSVYDERVSESTDGAPNGRIVYLGGTDGNCAGPGDTCPRVRGFSPSGDYVTIQGFEITSTGMSSDSNPSIVGSGRNLTVLQNYIHNTSSTCIAPSSDNLKLQGNYLASCGNGSSSGVQTSATTSNWLIEDNTITFVSDYVASGDASDTIVVRNNTFGPDDPGTSAHVDGHQTNSSGLAYHMLFEGNLMYRNQSSDSHMWIHEFGGEDIVSRYNQTYQSKDTHYCNRGNDTSTPHGCYVYSNTFVDNANYGTGTQPFFFAAGSLNNFARNNVLHNVTTVSNPYSPTGASSWDHDYDLWSGGQADPVETNDVTGDPLFIDENGGNFALTASSPAIDAGGHLTLANGSGSLSTSLVVDNAGWFQDGWTGFPEVQPDCIAVGTVNNTACITSINYSANVINLDSGLSWVDNARVWLYSKSDGGLVLRGGAPDIGAVEYVDQIPPPDPIILIVNRTGCQKSADCRLKWRSNR